MSPDDHRFLADLVLLLHWALAAFLGLGLPFIWVGAWRGWRLARSPWLRIPHLAGAGLVLAEALLGRLCPLTEWEWALRQSAGQAGAPPSFWLAHWAARLLYLDLPDWGFTALYAGFFLLCAATALLLPMAWPPRDPKVF